MQAAAARLLKRKPPLLGSLKPLPTTQAVPLGSLKLPPRSLKPPLLGLLKPPPRRLLKLLRCSLEPPPLAQAAAAPLAQAAAAHLSRRSLAAVGSLQQPPLA